MVSNLRGLYEETVASQIKVWDDEIEYLDAKADILAAKIEDRYIELIRRLRNKEKSLKEQYSILQTIDECDDAWLATRDMLLHSTEDMKAAICHAVEEISLKYVEVER